MGRNSAIDLMSKKSSEFSLAHKSFGYLLSHLHLSLGLHYIGTILFSLPVNFIKFSRDYALDKGCINTFSQIYGLISIICDIALFRLINTVSSEPLHADKMTFLPVQFTNKAYISKHCRTLIWNNTFKIKSDISLFPLVL